MAQRGTGQNLVRTVEIEADRAPIVRIAPAASFISQLIAERDRLPAQRLRRQAPVSTAIAAYHDGERRDARRLPQGFFRTAEA
jgi:hypothetical protein